MRDLEYKLDDASDRQRADVGGELQVVANWTDKYRQPEHGITVTVNEMRTHRKQRRNSVVVVAKRNWWEIF